MFKDNLFALSQQNILSIVGVQCEKTGNSVGQVPQTFCVAPNYRKSKISSQQTNRRTISRLFHYGHVFPSTTYQKTKLLDRDGIVVEIRDNQLSQKLQLDPELTLEKA